MSQVTDVEKFTLIKKVEGFANMGVLPAPHQIKRVEDFLADLERDGRLGADAMASTKIVVKALKGNILPAQEICRAGMKEVDSFLLPLLAERRARNSQAESQASAPRPRGF